VKTVWLILHIRAVCVTIIIPYTSNEMEILSFIIIQICIEFLHLGNSDCSGSWLAQLTFAVPYMVWYLFYLN